MFAVYCSLERFAYMPIPYQHRSNDPFLAQADDEFTTPQELRRLFLPLVSLKLKKLKN
jgi:hypothetical protein